MKATLAVLPALLLAGCINITISPEVTGRVIDADGNPLRATVSLRNDQLPNKSNTDITGPDGRFSVGKLRIWTQIPFPAIRILSTLEVASPGFQTKRIQIDGYDEYMLDVVMQRASNTQPLRE